MIKEKIVNKRLDSSVLIEPQNDATSVEPYRVILNAISFSINFYFWSEYEILAHIFYKNI